MNEGDYVRIRWGNGLQTISKCKNIVDMGDTQYAKDDFYIHTDHSGEVIYKTMIVKSSPNIIDLIEEHDILKIEEQKGVYTICEVEAFREPYENYDFLGVRLNNRPVARKLYELNIKSILTKEMFERMEYKIQ